MLTMMASLTGGQTAPGWEWMSPATMILIAIGMLMAVAIILWGARQRRRRKAAELEYEAKAELHAATPQAAPIDNDPAPIESAPAPVDNEPASVETVVAERVEASPVMPAVASAPPPLANAMPVIASASPIVERPAAAVAGGDDLTRMKGVGPKLAVRLGELGYTRFDQIAALTPAEAETLDAQLGSFRGRLTRDRWIEQARYLASDDRAGFEAAFGRL